VKILFLGNSYSAPPIFTIIWKLISSNILVIAAIFGIILIVFDDAINIFISNFFNLRPSVFEKIGFAILSGGVAGAILKVFATAGHFLEAVSEASMIPSSINKISQNTQNKAWDRITSILFLKNFDPDSIKHADIASSVCKSIKEHIQYDSNVYMKPQNRRLEFSWSSEKNSIIQILDEQSMTICVLDDNKKAEWNIHTRADNGGGINDYNINVDSMSINPDPISVKEIEIGKTEKRKTYELISDKNTDVIVNRTLTWNIEIDNSFIFSSPYFVSGSTIKIVNNAKNLRLVCKEVGHKIGGNKLYTVKSKNMEIDFNDHQFLTAESLLLPGQGFQISMFKTRVPPKRVAKK
jgi:hypothetical protein